MDVEERRARWQSAADEISQDICRNAVDERGVFCQHYDTDALDASVLLMPLVRFLPPTDERVRATVMAIANHLTVDGLVLRYRVEHTDDGFDDVKCFGSPRTSQIPRSGSRQLSMAPCTSRSISGQNRSGISSRDFVCR